MIVVCGELEFIGIAKPLGLNSCDRARGMS